MKKILKIIIFFVVALVLMVVLALVILEKKASVKRSEAAARQSQPKPKIPAPDEISPTPGQTSIVIDNSLENKPLLGKQTDNPDLLRKYGKNAFEAFRKNPGLVDKLKSIDSNFDPLQMDTSFPSHVYLSDNGKEYLALGGCIPHDCAGSEKIILYSEKSNLLFEAMENSSQTNLRIIGSPTEQEQNLIIYYYFHN